MSDTNVFGFGENDSDIGKKSKAWKAEGGNSYRMSFAWWNIEDGKLVLDGSPKFAGALTHYIQGVGYVVNKGPEFTKLAGEPPRQRILTFLVRWPTNKEGVVDKNRLASDFEVVPWVFSADKYQKLKGIHSEFSFADHDVVIACTDTNFQKMDFRPCRDSLLKTFMANEKAKPIVDAIVASVQDLATKTGEFIGREMTIQQVREKLAGGPGALTSTVGAGDSAAISVDIDNVVDDLLG